MTRITGFLASGAALLLALGGCSAAPSASAASQTVPNDHTPGWTGSTVVVGNTSTIAGDAAATELQQKWGVGRQR